MNIHTLDKAAIISELNVGSDISQAVNTGQRADFALLVSMFSNDVRDNTPVETVETQEVSDDKLRQQFDLATPQTLRSNDESYERSAVQANLFHKSGIASARLAHGLAPDALAYLPQGTHNLPEEVYHNLSGHERRKLTEAPATKVVPQEIYKQMSEANLLHKLKMSA
ncbi:VC2046/SO_2500 family protein [Vibrio penaeicida]|uniref:VC2046/SO_2500 family protein n=1 Tax=Vibrio penaeicida TaxID=104609 RepID=UPI000CEA131D|nr:VC2046/SO_2500 family protein [Vibrio penaeicida]